MTPTTTDLSRRGFAAIAAGTASAAVLAQTAAPAAAKGGSGGRKPRDVSARVEKVLRGMTLEQKIGQLFVAVGYGASADEPRKENTASAGVATIAEMVATHQVGGMISFVWSGNLKDVAQISALNEGCRAAAREAGVVPLILSTDEERGVVTRLPAPATVLPGNMALGATGDAKLAGRAGEIIGRELRACGFTQGYAPVVDVNVDARNPVIGVRSFGADGEAVADLGAATLEGIQSEGVSAAVKHFPGHGDTATDSHVGLPSIDHSREELDEIDLPPFRAAIEAGVDVIMTAHILVPSLDDSGVPATLSRPILTGLLREELGFDGVVVTDSLEMEGVRTLYPDDRVPVQAILAGADQMLMPPSLSVAIGGVREAVDAGEITEERLDESVRRILTVKARRGILDGDVADPDDADRVIGARRHHVTAEKIAESSITLISDDGVLPLRKRSSVLVTGKASQAALDAAVEELCSARRDASSLLLTTLDAAAREKAATAAAGVDAVVVMTSSSGFTTPADQVALVAALRATGTPIVHVALRNPYDVVHIGEVGASLATYSSSAVSVRAAARAIHGKGKVRGTLPVAIPTADGTGEAYPVGHGLRL